MAEHAHTTPTTPTRRRRAAPAPVGNVVTLPQRLTGTAAIVAEVRAKSKKQDDSISEQLQELVVIMDGRHRERANTLLPLAMRLQRPDLDDLIEIAQRMLTVRAR